MKTFLLLIAISALPACASHGLKYDPPIDHPSITTKEVNATFKKTWEQLVEGLAKSNFVIDSVSKDSGLIVASKKLSPPSSFADCGMWSGHFKNLRADDHYLFNGADDANYLTKSGDYFTNVARTSTLNSKSNIFVKKSEANKTIITVSSQFNLKFDLNMKTWVYQQGDIYNHETLTTEWTSQDRGRIDKGGQTQCVSTFSLESSILNLVK